MKSRKIYMASSWKMCPSVRVIAEALRNDGHQVFDFTDADNRPDGLGHFVFNASDWAGKPLSEIDWLEFLQYEATHRAFQSDRGGLDWADTLILVLPCGRSAHMEAGYAVGKGKDVFIIGELPKGEFDVMHLFARGHYRREEINRLMDRLLVDAPGSTN